MAAIASAPSPATSREWIVLATMSAVMIFCTGTTFASLGVVIFAMQRAFLWSSADAGSVFTVFVVACCLTQMLPVALIPRLGARWTVVAGCVLFAVAFLAGSATDGLTTLYVAVGLAAAAFSLVANTPGVFLIAGWSGERSARMIGLYLMIGTLGSAVGPPIAQALVSSAIGWRLYWIAMAAAALVLAIVCALTIREPPAREERAMDAAPGEQVAVKAWRFADGLTSPRFLILALAMTASQICVVTVSSVAPAHLATRGWSAAFAARMLGLQGFIGAAATGASGFLTKRIAPTRMLIAALLLQFVGMLLLANGTSGWAIYAFAPAFGIGWSVTGLAVTVLVVEYFGHAGGSTALATIWMVAGLSAAGPWLAGLVADAGWGFAPVLTGFGLMMPAIAAVALFAARPKRGEADGWPAMEPPPAATGS